jgi:hypothetical protein
MVRSIALIFFLAIAPPAASGQIARPWAEPVCVTQGPVPGARPPAPAAAQETSGYRCHFERWEYDPAWGPKDAAHTYATGVIACDRSGAGMLRVDYLGFYVRPAEMERARYEPRAGETGEHWVWTRDLFWEVLPQQKVVREHRGASLPWILWIGAVREQMTFPAALPLLIGLSDADFKQQFWRRDTTPAGASERWIELAPRPEKKHAATCRAIDAILDAKTGFPSAIQLRFGSGKRAAYKFSSMEINPCTPVAKPLVPPGWRSESVGPETN